MAGLSTHVLDTSKGKPAAELKIELYKILDTEKILIKTVLTNEDGSEFIRMTIVDENGTSTIIEIPIGSGYFGGDVDGDGTTDGG